MFARRAALVVTLAFWLGCGGQTGCSGGCSGNEFVQLNQGTVRADKFDSAAALRVNQTVFKTINDAVFADGGLIESLAPGGDLVIPIDCSLQDVNVAGIGLDKVAIADNGRTDANDAGCTSETCGRMNGVCDNNPASPKYDQPQLVTLHISNLSFAPKGPDVIEANVVATVKTGLMYISSVSRNSLLCFFSGAVKCSIDFDTERAMPANTQLAINIKLTIDSRWDRLLSFEVSEIGGSKVCGGSGAMPAPRCIDGNDVIIAKPAEASCNVCSLTNFSIIKGVLLDQIAGSLKKAINGALSKLNCASCTTTADCPQQGTSVNSVCGGDDIDSGIPDGGGTCFDTGTRKCVPRLLGVEGRLMVGRLLSSLGAPENGAIDLMVGLGGGAAASDAGLTIGARGGAKEVQVADCVRPIMHAPLASLPLPDFDQSGTRYDIAFSLSQQLFGETLFRAQQSGALCLELGHDQVAQLESGALAALLPSITKLTAGDAVPLRIVIRPVNPPTATVGANTVDAMGKLAEPLLRLEWTGLEIDVYALMFDRYARLFTIQSDVKLPIGLHLEACGALRPVIGSLTGAVTNVVVKNNELVPEPTTVFETLVPSLLSLAEPALSTGLSSIPIPRSTDGGTSIVLEGIKGIGPISGTSTFNHLAVFASLSTEADAGAGCAPAKFLSASLHLSRPGRVELDVPAGERVMVQIDDGLWSEWLEADGAGRVVLTQPRLWLVGGHSIVVRTKDGREAKLVAESKR